jgi:hypothetical protein
MKRFEMSCPRSKAMVLSSALLAMRLSAAQGGMVSHWPFDSDLNDSQSNYHGVAAGEAAVDTTISKVGYGSLKLDGDDDYVNVGNLNIDSASLSIAAWVRVAELDNTDGIFTKNKVDPNASYLFGIRISGRVWAGIRSGATWYATTDDGDVVPLDAWTHLAMIYDGAKIVRYINGVATGSDKSASGNIAASNGDAVIGSGEGGAGSVRDLNGHVDDLAVWDHALTTQQLARVIAGGALNWRGTGLIGYWPFDTETVFADRQGNYDGEARDNAHVDGDDKVHGSGSLELDGTSDTPGRATADCVKVFDAFIEGDALTLAAWVKLTGEPDEDDGVITKRNSLGDSYVLGIRDSRHVWAGVGTGGDALVSTADDDGGVVPLNDWTHIAMVYDGSEIIRYINGTETGTRVSLSGNVNNVSASAFVGCDLGAVRGWLLGRIDDAAIWNVALTADQIRNAMQQGPPEWSAARGGTLFMIR